MLTKKIQPEGQVDESQRQGPLKLQECYNHPHHPHPPRGAMTTILPCLPDHLRNQALRLLAQLSEHDRSIEKPAQTRRVSLNWRGKSKDIYLESRSARRPRHPAFKRENLAIGRLVAKQGRHPVSSCQVAAVVDNGTRG